MSLDLEGILWFYEDIHKYARWQTKQEISPILKTIQRATEKVHIFSGSKATFHNFCRRRICSPLFDHSKTINLSTNFDLIFMHFNFLPQHNMYLYYKMEFFNQNCSSSENLNSKQLRSSCIYLLSSLSQVRQKLSFSKTTINLLAK